MVTREEAERALDECHRELQALLERYGARLDVVGETLWLYMPDERGRAEPCAEVELRRVH